jgi:hypothetical protein
MCAFARGRADRPAAGLLGAVSQHGSVYGSEAERIRQLEIGLRHRLGMCRYEEAQAQTRSLAPAALIDWALTLDCST